MDERSQKENKPKKSNKIAREMLRKIFMPIMPYIMGVALVLIIIIFIASWDYFLNIDDGSYKEGEMSSTPYAAEQYTDNVTIDANGNISTSMTAQELWDEMIKNNSRVDEYLDGPEELAKLMNAQLVTDYLDTRPNPDKPIDWDAINQEVDSKSTQGIIKLKRADANGNVSTLIYTDPATFQSYIDNYNSTHSEEDKQKVLSYFTLENEGIESDSEEDASAGNYYAKVATWNEVTDTVESNDPEVEEYSTTKYNMTSTKINYQEFVKGYKMPFDYLWALLVISEDKDFVFDLADLVYNSELEITVHDNLSINTNILTDTYKNKIKTITDNVNVKISYEDTSTSSESTATTTTKTINRRGGPFQSETETGEYKTTHTTITKTNILNISLTKANVWIANYSQEYTHKVIDPVPTQTETEYHDDYPETPTKTDNVDSMGMAESFRESVHSNYSNDYTDVSTSVTSLTSEYYYAKKGTINITNTLENTKYVELPANMTEKTDKQSEEPNFVTILSEHSTALRNITSASSWLFEILETGKNTVDMVDLTKYLLYKTTDNDYGVTTYNFDIFDPSNFKSASGGIELLIEYIHTWENASGPQTNADGTKYIIQEDGAGNPTVGYGIDIFNGGYASLFEQAGYPTTIGGEVDKEFVDSLEKQTINEMIEQVRTATSDLGLTEYQIHALVSRAYNCGVSGAIFVNRGSQSLDFASSYTTYWNEEQDDQYEEKDSNANFEHSLYTEYMSKPTSSNGKYMAGLENRRKSEWVLFQTGYYDVLDKWYQKGGGIIYIADKIHKYMEENNYTYCVIGYNNYEECQKYGKSHGLNRTFEASKTGYHNTCCATYVSWVLQEAGYITEEEHTDGAITMKNILISKGWIQIYDTSELEPGDLLYYDKGHIEIYAGDGTVYNAGSGSAIRGASPANSSLTSVTFGLRAPN